MKRFKFIALAVCMMLMFAAPSFSTPLKLMSATATPGGFVLGGYFFYCSMNEPAGTIKVWFTAESNLTSPNLPTLLAQNYISYTPALADTTNGTWSNFISAQELFCAADGTIYLMWTQKYSATYPMPANATDTCFYAVYDYNLGNFGPPKWYIPTNTIYARSYFVSSSGGMSTEQKRVRIDPNMFQDGSNLYLAYVYFYSGHNNIMYAPFNPTTGLGVPVNLNIPFTTNIVEAPTVFKRGSYWYAMYSVNPYNQAYQIKYKKATTLAGLGTAANLFASPAPPTVTINGVTGVMWNMGHQHVFADSAGTYRILYTYASSNNGLPFWGTSNIKYDVYMDTLTFNADGTIQIVPNP